jgi:hypothetical protein
MASCTLRPEKALQASMDRWSKMPLAPLLPVVQASEPGTGTGAGGGGAGAAVEVDVDEGGAAVGGDAGAAVGAGGSGAASEAPGGWGRTQAPDIAHTTAATSTAACRFAMVP